jgi:hypothetical protein
MVKLWRKHINGYVNVIHICLPMNGLLCPIIFMGLWLSPINPVGAFRVRAPTINNRRNAPTINNRRNAPTINAPTQTIQPNNTNTPKPKSLGRLIGAFKTVSTKQINILRDAPGTPIWQRNYYEHIIRDRDALAKIREYIVNNPFAWEIDQLHPNHPSKW